jgi:hypothetical protein
MALGDRQHVEAVAIMKELVTLLAFAGRGDRDEVKAAHQWLAENHPEPAVYAAALREVANQ